MTIWHWSQGDAGLWLASLEHWPPLWSWVELTPTQTPGLRDGKRASSGKKVGMFPREERWDARWQITRNFYSKSSSKFQIEGCQCHLCCIYISHLILTPALWDQYCLRWGEWGSERSTSPPVGWPCVWTSCLLKAEPGAAQVTWLPLLSQTPGPHSCPSACSPDTKETVLASKQRRIWQ